MWNKKPLYQSFPIQPSSFHVQNISPIYYISSLFITALL